MLRTLLSNLRLTAGQQYAALAPETPFVAIGDIHGRFDLLDLLLRRVDQGVPVICVGDYIDRGDSSDEVLRFLRKREDITCLMGNHEEMLLNFLSDPAQSGAIWLKNGGLQTLASFGVKGITERSSEQLLRDARDQLAEALGRDLVTWIKSLPSFWRSGNVAVVHAGVDPSRPIDMQSENVLHWGHINFTRRQRKDGIWVVHGHTIVEQPFAKNGRVAIDTGAFATDRLTAALISSEGVVFYST